MGALCSSAGVAWGGQAGPDCARGVKDNCVYIRGLARAKNGAVRRVVRCALAGSAPGSGADIRASLLRIALCCHKQPSSSGADHFVRCSRKGTVASPRSAFSRCSCCDSCCGSGCSRAERALVRIVAVRLRGADQLCPVVHGRRQRCCSGGSGRRIAARTRRRGGEEHASESTTAPRCREQLRLRSGTRISRARCARGTTMPSPRGTAGASRGRRPPRLWSAYQARYICSARAASSACPRLGRSSRIARPS